MTIYKQHLRKADFLKPGGFNNGELVIIVLDASCSDQEGGGRGEGGRKVGGAVEVEVECVRSVFLRACSLKKASALCLTFNSPPAL